MTMAFERTRALRYGWQLLDELRSTRALGAEHLRRVEIIFQHYPSPREIKAKAVADYSQCGGDRWLRLMLAPENESVESDPKSDQVNTVKDLVTPSQRTRALRLARSLFVDLRSATDVPEPQRRQIPYVLRHFPDECEIENWAEFDTALGACDSEYRVWLSPESKQETQTR